MQPDKPPKLPRNKLAPLWIYPHVITCVTATVIGPVACWMFLTVDVWSRECWTWLFFWSASFVVGCYTCVRLFAALRSFSVVIAIIALPIHILLLLVTFMCV